MTDDRHPEVRWRRFVFGLRPLWIAVLNFIADDGPQRAGHIAFASLLAFFPFLIFLTALAGFFGQSAAAADFIAFAFEIMPVEVGRAVNPALVEVLERTRGGLLTVGLAGAVWVASSGIEALRVALNQAYGVRQRRPFWRRRAQDVMFVVLGSAGIIVAMVGVVIGPVIWAFLETYFDVPALWKWAWMAARYGIGSIGMFVVLCCLYRWLPSRRQRWRHVGPGAAVAVVAWLVAATLFSFYLSHVATYTVTYGSLGGVFVALVFFFVSAAVFIYGAEVNAALAGKPPPGARPDDPAASR
ncbi:MAG: YihY/virulence factor BrkB family protein [Alphaproteobacteria bacterium]